MAAGLLRFTGVLLLIPLGLLCALGALAPFSVTGWLYLLAAFGIAIGMIRRRRRIVGAAFALVIATLAFRLIVTSSGSITVRASPGTSTRWLSRVVDEQDISLCGAQVLRWLWNLQGAERDGLATTMREAYGEMRRERGTTATPALSTLLGMQSPQAFDTIVIEPLRPARAAIVFLHGFAGSFVLQCWLVSRAAQEIDAVTICPATSFSGHWSGADGEAIVRSTLATIRARGIQRIFLAGLSNGGVGTVALAPRFAELLSGAIVISGAPPTGDLAGLPVLVVQGEQDPMAPMENAKALASRTHGAYVGLEGGHFALLMRQDEARAGIVRWLRARAQ